MSAKRYHRITDEATIRGYLEIFVRICENNETKAYIETLLKLQHRTFNKIDTDNNIETVKFLILDEFILANIENTDEHRYELTFLNAEGTKCVRFDSKKVKLMKAIH